jgi:LPXTG-motif cell wall-anchored protein
MRVADTRAVPSRWFVALVLLFGAVFGSIAGGSAALASTYPPPDPILSLSDRELPPNTPFEATVTGCQPGEDVTFYLIGNDPITVTCGPDGTATVTLVSPPTPGPYDVTAVLTTTGVTLIDTIRVVATPVTPTIPKAGSDGVSATVLLGGGFVLLGGAFLLVARLRRRDTTPALA